MDPLCQRRLAHSSLDPGLVTEPVRPDPEVSKPPREHTFDARHNVDILAAHNMPGPSGKRAISPQWNSRRRVCNSNPYSESRAKTLKCPASVPAQFASIGYNVQCKPGRIVPQDARPAQPFLPQASPLTPTSSMGATGSFRILVDQPAREGGRRGAVTRASGRLRQVDRFRNARVAHNRMHAPCRLCRATWRTQGR